MAAAFAHCPQAVTNTLEVAKRCNLELSFGDFQFPVFATPAGESLEASLERSARAGLDAHLAQIRASASGLSAAQEQAYRERLEYELQVIEEMGFASYFLIVADFIGYAKSQGIPVGPGRGSAAGSLVAYALKITDVDPIRHQLLFERFLDPGRKSMPDIDVDFCVEREKKLFDYSLKLEGLLRHASKHAAGIVISPTPLVEHLPLFVDKEGSVLTQYAGPDVDTIGLIKFDFLGLKTLTLLDDAVK